jgi:Arc/MetJ-type ribon-helix-helix transcriptional regulator
MGKHETITAEIDEDIYAYVEAAVAAGEFASVEEALTLIVSEWVAERRAEEGPAETPEFVAYAKALIEESRRDPRPNIPADVVFAELRARYSDPA